MCLFAEIDIFKDWMPFMHEAVKIKEVTDFRAIYNCKMGMPWPLWSRDMVFTGTGIFDKKNKACMCVIKSCEDSVPYFGEEIPATADGHVRIIIKRGYHYF